MAQQNHRNSPHLSSHLQNGSAPPSPSMSNSQQQQQQGGQSRQQPVNYPSPTSYPSPSLSNAQYNYPPPNNQQVSEPYRASPTGSNGSLSLPSMRTLDPVHQQQQQQAQQQHHLASGLPPVAPMAGGPYYHNQGQTLPHPQHQYPNVTSDPTGQNMRYALPVTDSRVMSGGRHKKAKAHELAQAESTARKETRACDEAHPACRNCQKSKRECLGYDPIFKQQPGPTAIQPAPSSAPAQGGSTATANPYGHQPQMMPAGYGVPVSSMNYEPSLSAGVSSPGSASQQFDYSSAIDPALEAAAPPTTVGGNAYHQTTSGMPIFRDDIKRDVQSASPFSSAASDTPHLRGGAGSLFSPSVASTAELSAYTTTSAKRTVSELLAMGGIAPPPSAADVSQLPNQLEETKHLYYSIYAPGLENFLESRWFTTKGLAKLLGDKGLLDQFGTLLHQFSKTPQNDIKEMAYTASVEARIVWALANTVRIAAVEASGNREIKTVPPNDDPVEAGNRLTVFENLLTGQVAPRNSLTAPVPGSTDHHRLRELEFWYTLGNFVCLRDDDPASAKDIDNTLAALRNLLDGRENRDVLYSIAVVRVIGPRVSEYTDNDTPLHFDESDNKSKLLVAKKFVMDEGSGAGTTNVIRRLCELAARSWTTPAPAPPSAPVPAASPAPADTAPPASVAAPETSTAATTSPAPAAVPASTT
ncbi:uncharacterized protein BP5553_02271 [Venustampulla echinocandica]|uniref:Zn(2)-C6 fungal-type domain-containing protein n=1 Tax=Venustampulla echinocandica TaxID=2656787 RepID=A0A370U3E6_9HELO|nr:uncharacterized protein BP5553_02271 [Venustampulla echinocandica]RDL42292.1 hypothetical protein BP5553_02271 [Venustampulla echinocandica]